MHAAVVSSFHYPPRFSDCPVPVPAGPAEALTTVIAAGLHPRVRSQADGSHYTSTDELPLVPGIDGVGRTADGALRYFIVSDTGMGSMAEQTVIDPRRSVILPADADPLAVAAAMNPAMSSWIGLRRRIEFTAGQSVLILGATGSSGQLAVQVAKHLGAGQVVAAGRDRERLDGLTALGADEVVSLSGEPADVSTRLGAAAAEVDVVLDYVWGETTASTMTAVVMNRGDRGAPLTWIEVGSVGGPVASIPSAALRAARLTLVAAAKDPCRRVTSSANCPSSPHKSVAERSASTCAPSH